MPVETFRQYYNAAWRVHYRRTRGKSLADAVTQDEFDKGVGGQLLDGEEMECLLANMIFKVRGAFFSVTLSAYLCLLSREAFSGPRRQSGADVAACTRSRRAS